MKSLQAFFLLAMVMALAITLSGASPEDKSFLDEPNDDNMKDKEPFSSLRGVRRFLAQKSRVNMTCNKYPRICRIKGSPGPDCCKKKCVHITKDRLNCGKCGNKCKFSEICCKGQCVNPLSNKKHCGGCNNKCKKGNKCIYGMCSYA
ncbi:Stigma-specific Stig1 family protein [Forsythia ovata]|uniref:Stigma-specific Stig1 family protein n=1 Tax=Forsythia ovata TaxID=205694 RepID=A0ABD1S3V9_9LAMI